MGLLTLEFYIFFLAVIVIYYLLPGKFQWVWLFIASICFYISNSTPLQFLTFALIIAVNFTGTRFFEDGRNKRLYAGVLIFDIASLFVFKYLELLLRVVNIVLTPLHFTIPGDVMEEMLSLSEALCPTGISYFMLILIGYITTVYWGQVKAFNNPMKMALLTSYFPLITSGPIIEYGETGRFLFNENKKHFSYDDLVKGLLRVLWGVFKKLVISERLAIAVDTIYGNYETYTGLYIFLGAALFTLQLYTDFSGLMDIVAGISGALGIPLPENFRTPFYATSIAEFWRRWHITLGKWLRSYVFYPLQRTKPVSRFKKFCKKKLGKGYEKKYNIPMYICLLITWMLIGMWHGGSFKYIFGVGIYMGVIIIMSELLQPLFNRFISITGIKTDCFSYRLFARLRTFLIFIIGNSFFRADSAGDGFRMWKLAFTRFNPWIFVDGSMYELGLDRTEITIVIIGLILLFAVSWFQHREEVRDSGLTVGDLVLRQNFIFQLIVIAALFAMILAWGYYGSEFNSQDFIYGGF